MTDVDLSEALDACAREPIHIPGAIQPHGVTRGTAAILHHAHGKGADQRLGELERDVDGRLVERDFAKGVLGAEHTG